MVSFPRHSLHLYLLFIDPEKRAPFDLFQDQDLDWKTRLELRFRQPVHMNSGATVDDALKKKNIDKLKHAMYQSYGQQEGW